MILPGINNTKQIFQIDPGAGSKVHALQEAGNPGADFDRFKRPGVTGKIQVRDDVLLQRLRDGYPGRRRFNEFIAFAFTGNKSPEQSKKR